MSKKIIHCEWLDKQPDFYKDVVLDGAVLGRMKSLTQLDMNDINRKQPVIDSEGNPVDKDMLKTTYYMIEIALGGEWNLDRDLTMENFFLLPKEYREKFIEVLNSFFVTEAIAGN